MNRYHKLPNKSAGSCKRWNKGSISTIICLLMEAFESTEMVPGRTAHCFCEIDLMPGGSRNCIFEGAEVCKKAVSALIVSLFTHLQKSCLKQTQFICSKCLSVYKRKKVLRLGGSTCFTSSSASLFFFCEEAVLTRCGGRHWSVETTPIKKPDSSSRARLLASLLLCKDGAAVSKSPSDLCCCISRQA